LHGARVVSLSSIAARQSGRIHFDDLQFEESYSPMQAYGQSKLAVLMFARELDRRSREAGWGITSTAAHPGLTKTNLQISGPSHGRAKPSMMDRLYTVSWRLAPFLWQEIDEGILPAPLRRDVPTSRRWRLLRAAWPLRGCRWGRDIRQGAGARRQ
jgi:NAD(P)-dependent dehydrogenase (short-subunit alcohol dehydrogenase family)